RAFDWRVVISAGQVNHTFFAGKCVEDQTLKLGWDYLIPLGKNEKTGNMNALRVFQTVQFTREFQSNRTSQQPEIPPPEMTQNDLPQRWGIVKNDSVHVTMCDEVERDRCTQARPENNDRTGASFTLQRIECDQRGARYAPQCRRTRAPAKTRIVYAPDLNRAIIPRFRF